MKYVSWNVNGIRACLKKGFLESFKSLDADIFALQETKAQKDQIDLDIPGYTLYTNDAIKKGYSGTAVLTRIKPLSVSYGMGIEEHDQEGRVITLEFEDYYFVTCYTPNSKKELARIDYRMEWEDAFLAYLDGLNKPIILCGDLNVAHNEIDLKNPSSNHHNAGFSDQERSKMTELLSHGYIDTFRYLYPDKQDAYTWWSYMFKSRERNAGWRIDYFIVSESLKERIKESLIYSDILGSDHCPIGLEME
ncbi:exodeoxyribonuclease III [uncultured Catenibacterium sp.]|uniref:exodeoxyribonuclease III n=1 Tax=uncultured Catenibacterium sp. TaxID=286142 RepID=UPI0025D651CB|nr:exodeoxyribonuclease III [uncultured Catenibacterium sp.]